MGFPDNVITADETVYLRFRRHWHTVALPVALGVVIVSGLVYVWSAVLPRELWATIVMVLLIAISAPVVVRYSVLPVGMWRAAQFAFTDTRFLEREGVFKVSSSDVQLTHLDHVSSEDNLLDRLLHCGTLCLGTSSNPNLYRLEHIPRTRQVKVFVNELIRNTGHKRGTDVSALEQRVQQLAERVVVAGLAGGGSDSGDASRVGGTSANVSSQQFEYPDSQPAVARPPEPERSRTSLGTEVGGAIAVDIYLDTNDVELINRAVEAADELLPLLGYERPVDTVTTRGSIFRRGSAVAIIGLTSRELKERRAKVERALELAKLGSRQADVDLKEASAVANLVSCVGDIPQACLRLGSILLVKFQDSAGPTIIVRTLSDLEMVAIERFPEVQTSPRLTLEALAIAVSSLDSPVGYDELHL